LTETAVPVAQSITW